MGSIGCVLSGQILIGLGCVQKHCFLCMLKAGLEHLLGHLPVEIHGDPAFISLEILSEHQGWGSENFLNLGDPNWEIHQQYMGPSLTHSDVPSASTQGPPWVYLHFLSPQSQFHYLSPQHTNNSSQRQPQGQITPCYLSSCLGRVAGTLPTQEPQQIWAGSTFLSSGFSSCCLYSLPSTIAHLEPPEM